jgi:hypothetical protein
LHPSVIFFSSLFIAPYLAAEDQPLGRNRWAATVGPQPLGRNRWAATVAPVDHAVMMF